jgi:signal peptidase II
VRDVQEHGARTAVGASGTVRRQAGLLVATSLVVFALDQLTKAWAVSALGDRDIDLIGSLRLHLERNSGAAFSLNRGRGGLVALLAIAVVLVIVWVGRSVRTRPGALAIGLVLGGAVGNLSDRVFRDGTGFLGGAVVDFIDLQWWPVFNVADIAIVLGGLLLVVASTREQ